MNNYLANKAKKVFLDSIKLKVQGGTGGHGLPQYGGIGGKGGDVYIKGCVRQKTLTSLTKRFPQRLIQAGNGESARRTRLLGKEGNHIFIQVPLGVSVEDSDRQLLGDINKPSDKVIVALGGRGGDKFNDNQGFKGQKRVIKLDLKMISDAVFVGFPNAGKSSLLRVVSNATPKVAEYPFTTLKPNLGLVEFPDYRRISMADLPGLVEGAHKNLGLGHEFLKHIVRTGLLVFLIDINGVDLGPSYPTRSPLETICILNKEIELYDDTILNKPAILAMSKMDSIDDSHCRFARFQDEWAAIQKDLSLVEENLRPKRLICFDEILPISAKSGLNIQRLKNVARDVIDKHAEIAKLEKDKFSSYQEIQPLENNRIVQ